MEIDYSERLDALSRRAPLEIGEQAYIRYSNNQRGYSQTYGILLLEDNRSYSKMKQYLGYSVGKNQNTYELYYELVLPENIKNALTLLFTDLNYACSIPTELPRADTSSPFYYITYKHLRASGQIFEHDVAEFYWPEHVINAEYQATFDTMLGLFETQRKQLAQKMNAMISAAETFTNFSFKEIDDKY